MVGLRRVGGTPYAIEAEGYGEALDERLFVVERSQTSLQMTARDLILAAAGQFEWLTAQSSDVLGPQSLHNAKDFAYQPVRVMLDSLARAGDGDGTRWTWAVWEGPRLFVWPLIPPAVPDYVTDVAGTEEQVSFRRMASRVALRYRQGNREEMTGWQVNEELERLVRRMDLLVNGGELSVVWTVPMRA